MTFRTSELSHPVTFSPMSSVSLPYGYWKVFPSAVYSYTTGEACSFPFASSFSVLVVGSYQLAIAIVLASIVSLDLGWISHFCIVALRSQTWHWIFLLFATKRTNFPFASSEPSTLATVSTVGSFSAGVWVFVFVFMAFSFLCCVLVWDCASCVMYRSRVRGCNGFGRHGLTRQVHIQAQATCLRSLVRL